MEDVLVLDEMLHKHPNDRAKAFEEYSKHRNPDAEAMCDLALYNYIEVCLTATYIESRSYHTFSPISIDARSGGKTKFSFEKALRQLPILGFSQTLDSTLHFSDV